MVEREKKEKNKKNIFLQNFGIEESMTIFTKKKTYGIFAIM